MVADVENEKIIDNRPTLLKIAEKRNAMVYKNIFNPPTTLGVPKKGSPERKKWMAMDSCIKNVLSSFRSELSYTAFPAFIGYALLSNVSQEALIRAGVETVADEMTRKPVELYYDDDTNKSSEKLINDLNAEMIKYKVKETMNDSMLKDGFFGGCLIYIDVGDISDEEKEQPLNLDYRTFKKGSLRGFKVIEPINIAPGTYNTTDPTDEKFFNPEWWYVLGKRYDASRFLYIASNDAPVLLKPAYNFFGIPQAQMALDYVVNFVANRESAQELLNKFSLTGFGTDLSQALMQDGSWTDIINRAKAFNKFKTNNGLFVYDKEHEELTQINTPLGGVCDIVKMSLNVLTAIWHIPKIKYIGEGEGGLNASSQEQMRSYYDYIHSLQEKVFTNPYEKILKILQLNMGLKPDENLKFKFPPLWDMDENERAQLNKTLADRAAIYISNGVISQEEERRRLSLDRNSGYSDIDVDDVPEIQEQPLKEIENEESDELDKKAMDMAMDGRWITVGAREKGENDEDDEGRKGRHIYLDDGETPEEAIEELKNSNKENKKNKEDDDKDKADNKEKEKKNIGFGGKSDYFSSNVKESKTLKEAEENARIFMQEGRSANFSDKTTIENANIMNKTIAELMDKYGKNKGLLYYGDNESMRKGWAHSNSYTIEGSTKKLMSLDEKGINGLYELSIYKPNSNIEKAKERYKGYIEEAERKGFDKSFYEKRLKEIEEETKYKRLNVLSSPENTVKDIFTHEFGHYIYFNKIKKYGNIPNLVKDTLKKARKDGFIYNVSLYANSNKEEFFAECFVMREAGEKVPDYINQMLDEVIDK